ncbi:hypothetical protein ACF8CX_03855 [Vibrio mimicus]
MNIIQIQFPLSKRKSTVDHRYSPADTLIHDLYNKHAWYCDETYSIYVFTEDSLNEVQSYINRTLPPMMEGYTCRELAQDNLPTDLPLHTLEWIQSQTS